MTIHIVTSGESIYSIAQKYNIPMSQILGDNQLPDPSHLVVGQTIVIRYPEIIYTTKTGDTLYSIALNNGLTIRELWQNNPSLKGSTALYPDQQLVLQYRQTPHDEIMTYACATPKTDASLLGNALPFLTAVAPFTHSSLPTLGELNDTDLINGCVQRGTDPIFHVSHFASETGASTAHSHVLLSSDLLQSQLIQAITAAAVAGEYRGIDVDFQRVYGGDAMAYAQFVSQLRQAVAPHGLPVFVSLAPKQSGVQIGKGCEGHDYAMLGEAADYVILMPHEWRYAYGTPTAVAPLSAIRRMLQFAVTRIPKKKILLGIPNYGYNWTLPYISGTKAVAIGNQDAVTLAWNHRTSILYSEGVHAPHFHYVDVSGNAHEVWFEDARSIQAKLQLVKEFGLCGVSYWSASYPFPQNWVLLSSMYQIQDGIYL